MHFTIKNIQKYLSCEAIPLRDLTGISVTLLNFKNVSKSSHSRKVEILCRPGCVPGSSVCRPLVGWIFFVLRHGTTGPGIFINYVELRILRERYIALDIK
jgi:hypothetical protein